jgi:hypothetical protein
MRTSVDDALLARPTAGGKERMIARCVGGWAFAVDPQGVFHLDCRPPEDPLASRVALRHWDAETGRDRHVATLEVGSMGMLGLSVSPDGRSVLYTNGTLASDLMMIENFR